MKLSNDLYQRVVRKYGPVINLKEQPGLLQELVEEIARAVQPAPVPAPPLPPQPGPAPFGVSWMDSWVAHWVFDENLRAAQGRDKELATALRGLADLKFAERLVDIRRFIRDYGPFAQPGGPPDGGPPEPGTPNPGPSNFEPPDGGVPEPGVPPAGPHIFEPPDAGPPEPGVPPDPPPPEPPAGPDAGILAENPWVLYWFISLKAPQLLDVIDAHLSRRMNDVIGKQVF